MSSPTEEVKSSLKAGAARHATMLGSIKSKEKAAEASTVSDFVAAARVDIMLQIATLQASLDLLNSLEVMTDDEKLAMLFDLLDKDGDGLISAPELADGIRKRNEGMNFAESLDRAIDLVALFDADKNAKLDKVEFKEAIDSLLESMNETKFQDFAEYLIFQMVFQPGNDPTEELIGEAMSPETEAEVKKRGEFYGNLVDPRMAALFKLFDLDGSGSVSYKEVVIGIYQITGDMKEAEQMAVEALLLFDEDESRTLDYGEFAKLMMNIAAASDSKFGDMADLLTLAMCDTKSLTQKDTERLLVKEAEFEGTLDAAEDMKDALTAVGALQYTRLLKLFDLWDTDKDGQINMTELAVALRKFHAAMGFDVEESAARSVAVMLGTDQDGDQKLDPSEFALLFVKYAKENEVDLAELVDFSIVVSTFEENDPEEEAYLKAVAPEVSAEIAAIQKRMAGTAVEDSE